MIKQQHLYRTSIIKHTFLVASFSIGETKRVDTILEIVKDLPFAFIPFSDLSSICKFLEQAPTNTSILLNLWSLNENSLEWLEEISRQFPNYSIISIIDDYFNKQAISSIKAKTKYIIFQSDLNENNLNPLIRKIARNNTANKNDQNLSFENPPHYHQTIIDNLPDATFLCNMQGQLLDYNLATTDLLNHPFPKLKKTNIHSYINGSKKLLIRLKITGSIQNYPIEVQTEDKEVKYCLMTAQLIDDFEGYTATIRDITEQKIKEKIRQSKDLAQKSTKIKEQFLASISHEMRTPMNAILGMSNLALKTELNEEQYNYINSIKHSSQILLGVVNDILQISEIQNEKIIFKNKDFDLHELLYNLINVMQYKVKEKKLSLELIMAPNIPRLIRGDALRLNQILYNLVGNAIKFTDKGQIKIQVVNLGQNQYSTQLKFIVEDTGIGIPKEKIKAIFDSFTRVQTKDRIFEGTGLGLSIAKSLIQQQGGKIGVQSELSIGSQFFFDLIFEIGEEIPFLISKDEKKVDYNRAFKLLLVEDHKMNQLVARKTLEKQWKNIEITIANHGKEAISILKKEQPFDIILMDIQMPIMNGYETTKYIRTKMSTKIANIPILAMTAHAHISQDETFKKYGMNDYVLKPFNPELLFQKINHYLSK